MSVKVKLKTKEQLIKEGWCFLNTSYPQVYDIFHKTSKIGGRYRIPTEMIGKVIEVKRVSNSLSDCVVTLSSKSEEIHIHEKMIDKKLFSIKDVIPLLKEGKADAARHINNNHVCVYLDKETGILKKAVITPYNEITALNYQDTNFFFGEEYLLNDSWEIIIDELKASMVQEHKKRIINSADTLKAMGILTKEQLKDISEIIKFKK